jgi:hypothetical protein
MSMGPWLPTIREPMASPVIPLARTGCFPLKPSPSANGYASRFSMVRSMICRQITVRWRSGMDNDGYNYPNVTVATVNYGSVPLSAGAHKLTFTLVGKNPSSINYLVGIDYLLLTKTN